MCIFSVVMKNVAGFVVFFNMSAVLCSLEPAMIINRTQIKVHNDFILRFYTTHYSFACTWLQILLFVLDQITLELHVRMEDNESRGKREKCPLTNYIVSIIFSSWFLDGGGALIRSIDYFYYFSKSFKENLYQNASIKYNSSK